MGLSNAAKGCIACGVCTAVVLAIMIPVTILVIAPSMGQHALDVSVMNIPNATVYGLPDNLHLDHSAEIFNRVILKQTSLPFGAKLHETAMVMAIPASPEDSFFQWDPSNLAYFNMPEQDIKHGTNTFSVTTTLTVLENTDNFVHWAFMLSLGGFPYGATVYIAGRPELSALGILHMNLKLGKKLNCSYVPEPLGNALVQNSTLLQTPEESITARRLAGVGGMGPVTLTCMDDGDMDSKLLDAVLANFTEDLARTTVTTTTTPAPPTTTMAPTQAPPAPAPAPAPPAPAPAPATTQAPAPAPAPSVV